MMSLLTAGVLRLGDVPLAALTAKGTLVAGAVLLVAWLARRRRASIRHLILAAGFGALLILPFASAVPSSWTFDVPIAIGASPSHTAITAIDETTVQGAHGAESAVPSAPPSSLIRRVDTRRLPWVIWGIGALTCLLPVIAGFVQMRRYRHHGVPLRRKETQRDAPVATLARTPSVTLLTHGSIGGPMTYGVWRPIVLLPADSCEWPPDVLRRTLLHELEHVRRRDCLVHALSRIVCALYWFHPLVWVMWRQLALEAERACDDAVLDESEPAEYAALLVEFAERLVSTRHRFYPAMVRRNDLTTRVRAVLDATQPRGRAGVPAIGLAVICIVGSSGLAPLRAIAVMMPSLEVRRLPTHRTLQPPLPSAATIISRTPQRGAQRGVVTPPVPDTVNRPSFDAASIKVSTADGPIRPVDLSLPGRVTARNTLLRLLIAAAYQPGFTPRRSQMTTLGLPDWDETTRFDIDAVAPDDPTVNIKRLMLQSLLAERFNLTLHPEVRQGSVFELVTARTGRLGAQLSPHSASSPCVDPAAVVPPSGTTFPPPPPLPPPCGGIRTQSAYWGSAMTTRMSGNGVTMQALAERLTWFQDVDRDVVDTTGLAGTFDFSVEWTPNVQVPPPPGTDPSSLPAPDAPSEFTVLQEQLGLRLVPATGPVRVLVIDRVERPTGN